MTSLTLDLRLPSGIVFRKGEKKGEKGSGVIKAYSLNPDPISTPRRRVLIAAHLQKGQHLLQRLLKASNMAKASKMANMAG